MPVTYCIFARMKKKITTQTTRSLVSDENPCGSPAVGGAFIPKYVILCEAVWRHIRDKLG